MISIKEVSKQTGVTVRTLRHYDHIDLLKPSGKTDGGHRLYGEYEIRKLQSIQFLKTLRFSLQDIKRLLGDENDDWYNQLQKQLNYCLQEKQKIEQVEKLLRGLMNEFILKGENDLLHLQKLIRLYENNLSQKEQFLTEKFNKEERALLDLLPNMNQGDPDTVEWLSLLAQLQKHMNKGIAADEVQGIIRRMLEKEKTTFGTNQAFSDKIWEIRKSPEASAKAGFYPLDPEVLQFIEEAADYHDKHKTDAQNNY
ncbi:MerR family transcriptional regulator [Salipaludibacillus agaradhaerens]|uniref:MerR family transcriptional regulator n=1 Tax=Salipaludibacillus agaradhaerens TaxID=76935 RepID=UPI0009964DD4|nr:MerR family transcriptional regulator [Salipaludibacillus agaradhaerens]